MNLRFLTVSLLTMAFSFTAAAADWYLIATENNDAAAKGFDDPTAWSSNGKDDGTGTIASDFRKDDTYIVRKNALRLRVVGKVDTPDRTFAGGTLQIGHNKNHGALMLYAKTPSRIIVPKISLRHGCIYAAGDGAFLLDSDITVDTVNKCYTHIAFNNYDDMCLRLEGKLSATETSTLVMGMTNGFQTGIGKVGNRLEVASDCSGFNGVFSVVSLTNRLTSPDKSVLLGTTQFSGTMTFGQNCALGTLAATDVISIKNLSMVDNTFLLMPVDGSTAGKIAVTGNFTASGNIILKTSGTATPGVKIPVLEYPATEANARVHFVADDYVATAVSETENGKVSVYLQYPAVSTVYQTISAATLSDDEHWSDESTATVSGKNYVLALEALTDGLNYASLKLPSVDTEIEFNGDSLTIGKSCSLQYEYRDKRLTLNCDVLRMLDGSRIDGGQKTHLTINGKKFIVPSGKVKLASSNGRELTINSEIIGGATLELTGYRGSVSAPDGCYCFYALNTNFYGRIVANMFHDMYINESGFHARFNIVKIKDYRNLGGDLPELDPQALTLTKYDRLWVGSNDVDIPKKSNRGVFVNGNGSIHVEKKKYLRMNTQIAVNGTMYKTGEGTLELACPVRFGEFGDSTDPGDNDTFVITGGVVRACSADALDGLRVKFTDAGTLEAAIDMNDETMVRYGMRNTKAAVPFVLNEGESKMPFLMSAAGNAPTLQSFVVGAVTVDASAADAVRAMLPERAPKLFARYLSEWTTVLNEEDNSVTFAVRCYKKGMIFTVR